MSRQKYRENKMATSNSIKDRGFNKNYQNTVSRNSADLFLWTIVSVGNYVMEWDAENLEINGYTFGTKRTTGIIEFTTLSRFYPFTLWHQGVLLKYYYTKISYSWSQREFTSDWNGAISIAGRYFTIYWFLSTLSLLNSQPFDGWKKLHEDGFSLESFSLIFGWENVWGKDGCVRYRRKKDMIFQLEIFREHGDMGENRVGENYIWLIKISAKE